jgi:hypothetical protein
VFVGLASRAGRAAGRGISPRINVYKDNKDGMSRGRKEARERACKPRPFLAIVRFNLPRVNASDREHNPFSLMESSHFNFATGL